MENIRLLDLETVSPLRSQTCYHAAAEALDESSPDTIILVTPASPYVCIGFHQDPEKDIDLEYCGGRGWPVYRREVGGGAVYLDENQLFVQWIFRRQSLPPKLEDRFRLFIQPLAETYQALGIAAYHRPVNDIHVGGKKVGGTGAAEIGAAEVLVGSLMFDFDRQAMARVLKVPSEKMRDKNHQSLEQYMTTIRDELGCVPDRRRLKNLYLDRCSRALGRELTPCSWSGALEARALQIDARFRSREWLFQEGAYRRPGIKIHEDVEVTESVLKAPGGLIRLTVRLRNGRVEDLSVSGDFTIFPRTAVARIERALVGSGPNTQAVLKAVEETYRLEHIQSPGIEPEHWAEALSRAFPASP
jgi:lipoate-protein ligase A